MNTEVDNTQEELEWLQKIPVTLCAADLLMSTHLSAADTGDSLFFLLLFTF